MFNYKIILNNEAIKEYKNLNITFSRISPIPSSFNINDDSMAIIKNKEFNTFFTLEATDLFNSDINSIFDEIFNILKDNEDKILKIQLKLNNSQNEYNDILNVNNFGLVNRVYKIDSNTGQIFNQVQLMCKI